MKRNKQIEKTKDKNMKQKMQKEIFIQSKIKQHKIKKLTKTKPGEPGGTRGNPGKNNKIQSRNKI